MKLDRRGIAELASAALALVGKAAQVKRPKRTSLAVHKKAESAWRITVAVVRDQTIRRLNREYRGKDYATDVLSFPASAEIAEGFEFGEANFLGDVVISVDTAWRQAQEARHSFEREVEELVIHGVLHLCGYDHETDNGEMNRLELQLRKRLLDQGLGRSFAQG
ncbi:MAG: rRNA maturation RNase YbeY [Acidobacteria bacterium]|nr:rRNA maturation RNase YbeY [Acidobacteriota bacterium]